MSEFKIGTIGTYLEEHDGERPTFTPAIEADGLVVETRGQYLARIAAGESAVATKPKRGRKAADAGDDSAE